VDGSGRGKYIASFTPTDGTKVTSNETHFMFRFEANGPSSICFRIDWAGSWLYLNNQATIEVLKDGTTRWETKTVTAGERPQIQFDEAFSGYIKFAYLDSSIIPASEREITNIHLYTYGMGTVGENTYATEMTVGPFFTVTFDSTSSEINVPDEPLPPAEEEEPPQSPIDATPLGYSYNNGAISAYVTVATEKPCNWTNEVGRRLTLKSGADFEKADNKVATGARGIFNFTAINVAEDDTHFIFHFKSNDKIIFAPVFSSLGGYPFALRRNCTVQVLKDGETKWKKIATVATGDNGGNEFGGYAIKFDEAFSGLIKIAYKDIGHDEKGKGHINSNEEKRPYPLTQFLFYPKAMGTVGENTYATDVTVGPFFTAAEAELPPPAAGDSVDPRPNGPAENYLNQLSATLIGGSIEIETEGVIERRAVYPLADLPSAIGCQIVPINASNYEVPDSDLSGSKAKAVYFVNSPISGNGSVVVYVKAYAGNMFLPQVEIKNPYDAKRWNSPNSPYMTLAVGDEYEFLSAEFEKWQRGVAVAGVSESSSVGAIYFEKDFEGYIKLPFESLVNDKGFIVDVEKDSILRLKYSFKGVGGKYGQVIAGPSFFIKDGESADRLVTVPQGAVVIDTKPSIRATLNLTAQPDYVRAGNTVLQGYRINGTTEVSGRLPFSYAGIFLLDLNDKYTDSNYLTFYIELPGPNKLGVAVNKQDGNDSMFKEGY
ncbi:MAG: hypothetical protein J6V50_01590, partial [Clostridia bacterium]|nr:hypothetical protein [Clostridia bacterium]